MKYPEGKFFLKTTRFSSKVDLLNELVEHFSHEICLVVGSSGAGNGFVVVPILVPIKDCSKRRRNITSFSSALKRKQKLRSCPLRSLCITDNSIPSTFPRESTTPARAMTTRRIDAYFG